MIWRQRTRFFCSVKCRSSREVHDTTKMGARKSRHPDSSTEASTVKYEYCFLNFPATFVFVLTFSLLGGCDQQLQYKHLLTMTLSEPQIGLKKRLIIWQHHRKFSPWASTTRTSAVAALNTTSFD